MWHYWWKLLGKTHQLAISGGLRYYGSGYITLLLCQVTARSKFLIAKKFLLKNPRQEMIKVKWVNKTTYRHDVSPLKHTENSIKFPIITHLTKTLFNKARYVDLFYGIDFKGFQQDSAISLITACLLFFRQYKLRCWTTKKKQRKKAQINRQMNK